VDIQVDFKPEPAQLHVSVNWAVRSRLEAVLKPRLRLKKLTQAIKDRFSRGLNGEAIASMNIRIQPGKWDGTGPFNFLKFKAIHCTRTGSINSAGRAESARQCRMIAMSARVVTVPPPEPDLDRSVNSGRHRLEFAGCPSLSINLNCVLWCRSEVRKAS
jgi:hypothetical protein